MPYWEMLGRYVVARGSEADSERIIQYLTYSGLDATMAYDQEHELYVVSVPREQQQAAEKIMNTLRASEEPDPEVEEAYVSSTLIHSPAFVRAEDKFKDTTSSAIAFIAAGSIVFLMALAHCSLVVLNYRSGSPVSCLVIVGLGSVFLYYGIITMQKANDIKGKIEAENEFTTQVIEWCVSTYPSVQLDNVIRASEDGMPATLEERYFRRKDLIRCYILREFSVEDPSYLEYLAEETYISIFEKQKLGVQKNSASS